MKKNRCLLFFILPFSGLFFIFNSFGEKNISMANKQINQQIYFKPIHSFDIDKTQLIILVAIKRVDCITFSHPETLSCGQENTNFNREKDNLPKKEIYSSKVIKIIVPNNKINTKNKNKKLKIDEQFIKEKFIEILKQHYQKLGGNLDKPHILNEDMIEFTVRGLRNKVLKDENQWEKIKGSLIFYQNPEENNNLKIFLHLDVYSSSGAVSPLPGVGPFLPSDRSYRIVSPDNLHHVEQHANELLTELKSSLEIE